MTKPILVRNCCVLLGASTSAIRHGGRQTRPCWQVSHGMWHLCQELSTEHILSPLPILTHLMSLVLTKLLCIGYYFMPCHRQGTWRLWEPLSSLPEAAQPLCDKKSEFALRQFSDRVFHPNVTLLLLFSLSPSPSNYFKPLLTSFSLSLPANTFTHPPFRNIQESIKNPLISLHNSY